jgi:hypothetical protein
MKKTDPLDLSEFEAAAKEIELLRARVSDLKSTRAAAEARVVELAGAVEVAERALEDAQVLVEAGEEPASSLEELRKNRAALVEDLEAERGRPLILEKAIARREKELASALSGARPDLIEHARELLISLHAGAVAAIAAYAVRADRCAAILAAARRAGIPAGGKLSDLALPRASLPLRAPREGSEWRPVAIEGSVAEELRAWLSWITDRVLHPPAPPAAKPAFIPRVEPEILGEKPESPEQWREEARARRQ